MLMDVRRTVHAADACLPPTRRRRFPSPDLGVESMRRTPSRRRTLTAAGCAVTLAGALVSAVNAFPASAAAPAASSAPIHLNNHYSFQARAAELVPALTFAEQGAAR